MNLYIPVKTHVSLQPMDMLQSPKGNHYWVVKNINEEILTLRPMQEPEPLEPSLEFSIRKIAVIELGWKKRMN